MNMESKPRALEFKTCANGVRTRRASLFPLGISATLIISFIAVAVLAATANLIARKSVSVIFWNTPAYSPVPLLAQVPQKALSSPAVSADVGDTKRADTLMSAADGFERATQMRAASNSPSSDAEYAGARALLVREVREPRGAVAVKAPLAQSAMDNIESAQRLIRLADQRRLARQDHSTLLESSNERIRTALDRAFTIFGRVIAPRLLLQLRAELDAMRQHSAPLFAGETIGDVEQRELEASEHAYTTTLEDNAARFSKSQGADWVQRMRTDSEELIALRKMTLNLNLQYSEALRRVAKDHASLFAAISAATAPATLRIATPTTNAASLPAKSPPMVSPSPLPNDFRGTAIGNLDHRARDLMALVTAIVLLLVTAISILTVRSVVGPVRRILRAARELAAGRPRVRVVRGGIRELDTLAEAFNDMAARLAVAQDASRTQQETLEEKVRERTHKLQTLAQQDPLTSLPNRRHLSALLGDAIARAAVEKRYVGVYFLDVDNFKNFNDSLGHVFGDRVLMSVGNRLEELADSLGFVARLGGDEFTFVLESAETEQSIHEMGSRLVNAFQRLLSVDERELSVSVSVGASIFPDHGRDAEGLLKAADSALFRAKELGRSRLAVFTPELIETAAARFTIEQGLRRALEDGEFELVYQPEIDMATLEVGLVEALLRWRTPDGRLARPAEFLAVAEQSGLISDISKWVMRTAIEAASRWHHGGWPGARVAINISPRQLLDPRFAESLVELLREFQLPASAIELELTETVMQTGSATVAALRVLQANGFGIALDDFGTGYSSLTSLEQLPLSRIKLDRSLIASIDSSARSAAIVRAIIDLCSGLALAVTAEGVERPTQLAFLSGNRSMFLQGFLFSEGIAFDDVLSCRAMLLPKMHNLLLSMPAYVHPRTLDKLEPKGIATG